jgi:hypothetical protein
MNIEYNKTPIMNKIPDWVLKNPAFLERYNVEMTYKEEEEEEEKEKEKEKENVKDIKLL